MKRTARLVKMARQPAADLAYPDLAYWLSRPMSERIAAVEVLRAQARPDGETDAEPRLQRVCRVVRKRARDRLNDLADLESLD